MEVFKHSLLKIELQSSLKSQCILWIEIHAQSQICSQWNQSKTPSVSAGGGTSPKLLKYLAALWYEKLLCAWNSLLLSVWVCMIWQRLPLQRIDNPTVSERAAFCWVKQSKNSGAVVAAVSAVGGRTPSVLMRKGWVCAVSFSLWNSHWQLILICNACTKVCCHSWL